MNMRKVMKKVTVAMLAATMLLGSFTAVQAADSDFPDSDQRGTLTVHKFNVESFANLQTPQGNTGDQQELPQGATAVEGVTFTVQRLDDSDGKSVSVDTPLDATFEARTQVTGSDGSTAFTDLPKGYYLVTETIPDGTVAQKSKYVVMLPMRQNNSDGTVSWNYDVHTYPKNTAGPQLTKEKGESPDVVGVGSTVEWVISYPVGQDIWMDTPDGRIYAKDFYITDTMDTRMDYVEHSAQFAAYSNGTLLSGVTLNEGTEYTEVYDNTTKVARWTYTDAGVKKLADNGVTEVKVTIQTVINESARGTMETVWNDASIDFINTSGDPYHLDIIPPDGDKNGEDVPKVWLGSIIIDKYETGSEQTKLAGATFKVATSEADAKAGKFVQIQGSGQAVDYTVETDAKGAAVLTALPSGTYYLVETKAPEGYQQLTSPVEVTIGTTGATAAATISIGNEKPKGSGGGAGGGVVATIAKNIKTGDKATIAGLLLMLAVAGAVVAEEIVRRKKRAESL